MLITVWASARDPVCTERQQKSYESQVWSKVFDFFGLCAHNTHIFHIKKQSSIIKTQISRPFILLISKQNNKNEKYK